MSITHKSLVIIAGILLLLLLAPSVVYAGGLTVINGRIETILSPNKAYSQNIGVQNSSDAPMDIIVELRGYGTKADSDFVALEEKDDSSGFSARNYIEVSPDNFHLEIGESKNIKVDIQIPQDVGDGGRYAILYIHTIPKEGAISTISGFTSRVLISIEGSKLNHDSMINNIEIKDKSTLETSILLKNDGNHHYKPHINAKIMDSEKTLATAKFDGNWPIIPGYEREYSLTFMSSGTLPIGEYTINVQVKDDEGNIVATKESPFKIEAPFVPPLKETPTTIILIPSTASTLKTDDGRISIEFPKGAVLGEAQLSLQSYPLEKLPTPPAGYTAGTTAFRVDGLNGLLAKNAAVNVKYSSSDLDKAGGDASRLVLARWDEAGSNWSLLKTSLNSGTQTLSAQSNQFSLWAILISPQATTTTSPANTGGNETNWTLIGGIILLAVIIVLYLTFFVFFKPKKRVK